MASTVDAKRVQEYSEASEEAFEAKIDKLADMVRSSRYTVFYTGAGMSTSAGVGDYRGPSGAWTQRRIKELQRLGSGASAADAQELRKLLAEQQKEQAKSAAKVPMTDAQPTLSHMMQSTLIRKGFANFVVTTNLDGIYRKAGLQAHDDVCFLHGDVYTERCTSCGYDFERNWHVRQSNIHVHDHSVGSCSRCGSKPPQHYTGRPKGEKTGADCAGFEESHLVGARDQNVGTKDTHINFGECLDEIDWNEAELHCSKADLCIVMGTSMSLRHITHFPFQAKQTVIVNLQKTPDDKKCDLRIWAKCDIVSAGLLARLGLEPMPVPVWRPRDALPLSQLPYYVSQPYKEAAKRLMQLAEKQEQDVVASVAEETSRLSVKDGSPKSQKVTVVVGNSHKEVGNDRHCWRLYVAGNGADELASVEVRLHPTFKQNHFKLDTMPFELECTGWGTFDVNLRLHKKSGGCTDVTWPLQFDQHDAHTLVDI
jgi:NAD-dependent SIR2 family protein deacetylase